MYKAIDKGCVNRCNRANILLVIRFASDILIIV